MGTKVSASGIGEIIKIRYLGDAAEPQLFVGAATRNEYHFGGKINLQEVDTRDLATGKSYAPGLFELTGPGGAKLFEVHVPLKERKAEAKAVEEPKSPPKPKTAEEPKPPKESADEKTS